jgi:aryl-alcohol dehydrogenase-like predicted oxidoreductase
MEYRQLGASGLKVSALSFGAGTFGGKGPLFSEWGNSDVTQARELVSMCIDAGVNMFDTADVYSDGASEEILGSAVKERRHSVLLSTKLGLPTGDGPNEAGTSRARIINGCDLALRRLQTDYIDLLQLHAFDSYTPIEETLAALEILIRSGKVRYIGVSNFAGWQLMKSLAIARETGTTRYVAHQIYYSLIGRDYEWELMPLAIDQNVGALVWSPLGWGRLTGKIRRGSPIPAQSRLHATATFGPPVEDALMYSVIDVLDQISNDTGRTVPQIAINWLLQRPTVSSIIIGARNEAQLRDNLGAVGWSLTPDQMAALDAASARVAPYPYYPYRNQAGFARLNPAPV